MVIQVTASNLTRLISSSEKARDKRLRGVKDMIARYQGPERAGDTSGNDAPENHEFSVSSLTEAFRAHDVPFAQVTTALNSADRDARALQAGLNRWMRDTNYRSVMRETSKDYDFAWAVTLTTERPAPELGEHAERGIPWRPYVKRIPFKTAFWDPLATSAEEVRFAGHMEVADRQDLIRQGEEDEDSGWDVEALKAIAADSGVTKLKRETIEDSPSRDEIAYYQIWVRDAEITDEEFAEAGVAEDERHLYHGKLYYLPVEGGAAEFIDRAKGDSSFDVFLRKPQLYYGPQCGPYTFFGAYVVPDDPFPLSVLMPNKAEVDALNRLVASANSSDENYAKFTVSGDDALADQIKNAKHDFVYTVDGLGQDGKTAIVLEKGGSSNQQQAQIAMRRDRLGRNTGLTEMQQAATGVSNSASEAVIANSSAEARMSVQNLEFFAGHDRTATIVSWYLWHDDSVVFPLSQAEAQEAGIDAVGQDGEAPPQQFFFGGKPPSRDSFHQLEVRIEITSVQRVSEQQRKLKFAGMIEYLTWAAQTFPVAPWMRADIVTETAADLLGIPELTRVVNMESLRLMSEALAMQTFGQQPGQEGQQGPKLAGDMGGRVLQMPKPAGGPEPKREGGPNKPAAGKNPGRSVGTQAGKATMSA